MDQKNCVGNILFFKNVWRGPLCSRRAGSLVIKLFTWDLGGYNVKSVNRIKQNRELNQCFLHPVHCHNCRAVNCFFQTLKILLWTCEDQIGADTIFQRSVFIACSFKKKKKRQNRHLWCKYPTSWPAVLLNHEECLSPGISFSRQSKRQEGAPRKSGVPSECCSVQAAPGSSNGQWLPTWGVLFRDWCNSVIPVNQTLPLMLKFRHSLSFGGICILTIPIFQRCQTREKGCLFFSLHWQFCLHLWTVKAKCLSSKTFPWCWWEGYWVFLCLLLFFSRYAYLQRYAVEPLPYSRDEWQPLIWYKNSLLANEDEESSVLGSLGEWSQVGTSKASSCKRKLSNGMGMGLLGISCAGFVPAKMRFVLCVSGATVYWTLWPLQLEPWRLPSALLPNVCCR